MRDSVSEEEAVLCALCRERLAAARWSYVYGRTRRGVRPLTGEVDSRPLGTDVVPLCRRCERKTTRANLGESARRHPFEFGSAVAAVLGAVWGAEKLAPGGARFGWIVVAFLVTWLALVWVLRRPKRRCQGVFLLRRTRLASKHGLSPEELEPYLDLDTRSDE